LGPISPHLPSAFGTCYPAPMKSHYFIVPLVLALAACSTPEERAREDARDRQAKLRKEAQERFEDRRKQERERQEDVEDARRKAQEDARDRAEDIAKEQSEEAKRSAEYHAYLNEYARTLGKKPSQLSPEELKRIHDKFY
jgi:Skp family chaperone for outer membrane proteins